MVVVKLKSKDPPLFGFLTVKPEPEAPVALLYLNRAVEPEWVCVGICASDSVVAPTVPLTA